MAQPQHETRYRVVAQMVKGPSGKNELRYLVAPYETEHRPGPDKIYTIIGPDRELAVENCRQCRRPSTIVDNRNSKV